MDESKSRISHYGMELYQDWPETPTAGGASPRPASASASLTSETLSTGYAV